MIISLLWIVVATTGILAFYKASIQFIVALHRFADVAERLADEGNTMAAPVGTFGDEIETQDQTALLKQQLREQYDAGVITDYMFNQLMDELEGKPYGE